MQLYILTGDTGTGKTTRLMQWCKQQANITGIVTPVIDGKRFFYDITTEEKRMMEAVADETDVQAVGKYLFSSRAFMWAESMLHLAITSAPDYIVIDEIGPLELLEKGFNNILKELLQSDIRKIILVVRRSKVEEVIAAYHLQDVKIIEDPLGIS